MPAKQFSGSTPWPLPQAAQAEAIKTAIEHYGVLPQVFMGMYSNETNFGNFRNADGSIQTSTAGAVGPFQFTSPHKTPGLTYPMTSTPNFNEFIAQANAAAAYLKSLYNQLGHSWRNALAGYLVGGSGNLAAGMGYADKAMAAPIPASWSALIGSGPALPGGTAGAGGTGALLNQLLGGKKQANFTVGDPTNPDEDYWTAINRLAQERYWYLFSDGETLYLADGPDLMKQEPAARLDRIGNLDQINHLSYTWDNPLALNTPLLTTRGWKTMGTVAVGDHVYAEDGNSTRVLGASEVFPDKPCFELTFADGAKIVASDDHHWKVKSAPDYNAPWQNLTTREIADNWRYQTTNRYRIRCDAVPQYSPVELPPEALHGKRHRTTMSITNVQSVAPVPTRCIMVEDESHVFLVGRTFVPTRNTAWRYAVTHKKRKRAQRRTSLAKVVSPVEATLELICAIDEARAGDVIDFSNAGPGDGSWLVGDCRRSVFEILSEINLVVALTPLSEGALNPAGINTNNLSALLGGLGTGTGNYKGYVNPVGNWHPNRIDQGVDGTLVSNYLAPGDSHIAIADASNHGWNGGGAIAGRFLNGPLAGKFWYVTEGVAPLVPPSSNVTAGTPVARPATSPYGNSYGFGATGAIETGWGNPGAPTQPLAQTLPGYGGDHSPQAVACGDSFNRFLRRVGAKPGSRLGSGVGVTAAPMPPGYP